MNWPFDVSESQGLTDEEHIVSLPLNDLEESLRILNSVKKDLAGVLIEPVLGGGGAIPATQEYLRGIQEMVKANNALFMLDEIVTGFRFRYGCLYPKMKLDPDIVTLGKIVGGGFPIGVICGKDEIMKHANTSVNSKKSRTYIGGGTFSANPLSMIAGDATLQVFKKDFIGISRKLPPLLAGNPVNYSKINKLTTVEAIAGAAFILGHELLSKTLLEKFTWGHTFFELNQNLLQDYKDANSEDEVIEIIRAYGYEYK